VGQDRERIPVSTAGSRAGCHHEGVDEDRETPREERKSSIERLLAERIEDQRRRGRPLSNRARLSQRSVEAYLKAGVRPRWMERVTEIDQGIAMERRRLERAYRALREECGADAGLFARRWRSLARGWRFDDELNELIRQHNEWYPVERDLPMNPRTGDYVLVNGRTYRRPLLGPDWVLEHFPAVPGAGA
jgi:hypothetical protein